MTMTFKYFYSPFTISNFVAVGWEMCQKNAIISIKLFCDFLEIHGLVIYEPFSWYKDNWTVSMWQYFASKGVQGTCTSSVILVGLFVFDFGAFQKIQHSTTCVGKFSKNLAAPHKSANNEFKCSCEIIRWSTNCIFL